MKDGNTQYDANDVALGFRMKRHQNKSWKNEFPKFPSKRKTPVLTQVLWG